MTGQKLPKAQPARVVLFNPFMLELPCVTTRFVEACVKKALLSLCFLAATGFLLGPSADAAAVATAPDKTTSASAEAPVSAIKTVITPHRAIYDMSLGLG